MSEGNKSVEPDFGDEITQENGSAVFHNSASITAPASSKEENKRNKKQKKIEAKKENERRKQVIMCLYDMNVEEIKCGIGPCTSRWFQVFATAEVYLIVYCIAGLVLGMFFTYSMATISTYEKRFKLTSKQTGVMLSGNDISQVLLALVASYYGNYGHRPRWVAVGCFMTAIASALAALPHLIYGPGEDATEIAMMGEENNFVQNTSSQKILDFCHSPYIEDCSEDNQQVTDYIGPVLIHFISQCLQGIVVALLYTIGFAYMDDNVKKQESPIYYSISYIIRIVGPVFGYFLGSKCLALYIIPTSSPNLNQRDPRWLGAWWIGYLILSALMVLSGCLLLLFPRTLPNTLYFRLKACYDKINNEGKEFSAFTDLQSLYQLTQEKEQEDKPSLKKLPTALKRLLRNKIFIGNNIYYVFSMLAFFSYWTFKPKFLEFQFRISASEANMYAGIASLVASILGFLVSAIVMKIFKPGPRSIALYSLVVSLWNPIMMVCLIFLSCPKLDIQGPMQWHPGLGSCDSICDCSDRYSPVCSQEGNVTFYSSCYAGCSGINADSNPVEYYDCSCSPGTSQDIFHAEEQSLDDATLYNNFYPTQLGGNVTQGYCPEDCNAFFYYVIVTTLGKAITATPRIGATLLFLRSIEERDKGLALGFVTVVISLFAFIPAPIIMGAIVDSACIVWDKTCGVSGNCWLFDSDKLRIIIHAVPAMFFTMSLIGDLMVYLNSAGLLLYGENDAEINDKKEKSHKTKEMTPLTSATIAT